MGSTRSVAFLPEEANQVSSQLEPRTNRIAQDKELCENLKEKYTSSGKSIPVDIAANCMRLTTVGMMRSYCEAVDMVTRDKS